MPGHGRGARWHTAANHATFQYEFNHPVPGQPDAIHSTELSFVFGFFTPEEGEPWRSPIHSGGLEVCRHGREVLYELCENWES